MQFESNVCNATAAAATTQRSEIKKKKLKKTTFSQVQKKTFSCCYCLLKIVKS